MFHFGSSNRQLQKRLYSYQKGISFEPLSHLYYYKSRTMTSVTTAVSGCFPRFDRDGSIAAKCAEREGVSVPEIRKQWRRSGELGTLVHNSLEAYIWGYDVTPFGDSVTDSELAWLSLRIAAGQSLFSSALLSLANVLYTELTVYSSKYSVAGTVDLVVFNPETGALDLYDWKTSKNIMAEGVTFGKRGFGRLAHLPDTNFYHYALQLSIYRWILEQAGFKVGDLAVIHLSDKYEDGYKFISMPYLADEALAVLEASL